MKQQPRAPNSVELAALKAKKVKTDGMLVAVFKLNGARLVTKAAHDPGVPWAERGEDSLVEVKVPVPDYLAVVATPDGKTTSGFLLTWDDLEATKG